MLLSNCLFCTKPISARQRNYSTQRKYCSLKCQQDEEFRNRFAAFMQGDLSQVRTPRALKRCVVAPHGYKCAACGLSDWMGKEIALELDHIDGNSDNGHYTNLRLLCPNCHSQTHTFKAKNKGNGRHFRRERYAEGKSF